MSKGLEHDLDEGERIIEILNLKLEAATQLLAACLLSKYEEGDKIRPRQAYGIAKNAIEAKYLTLKQKG